MQAIIRYELVINEALRSALMLDTPDEQIDEFIRFFGKHIGCDRIYIFEDNKKEHVTDNTYEWCRQGIESEIDYLQGVDMDIIDWWYKAFDKKENVIIRDVETIKNEHVYTYNTLKIQNVKRLVVCPIRYKNEISGFFGVDNPPIDDHLGLTTFLDMIATLVISFLKIRNSQNKSKREAKLSGYSALGQIYTSMHYINVKTNRFHIVKMEPQILTYLGKHEIYDIEDNFTDHICKIHRKFCQADYVDREVEFMDLETLEERLQGKKSIDSVFYGKLSGWCRSRFIPVDYDEDGSLLHVLYCVECIDDQKKREDKLLYLAQTDTMTGISNRRSGEKMIERVLNNKVSGMMCLVDCDKFKWLCHNKQLINSHFYRGVSELPYKLLFAVIYTHLEFRYEVSHTITSHHVHHFHQTRIPDGTLLDYMVQYRKPLFPQFFLYPKKFLPENNPHHKEFHLRPYIQNNANQ